MCDCRRIVYADDVDDERTEYYRCETHAAELKQLGRKNAELYSEMKRIQEEIKKVENEFQRLQTLQKVYVEELND